MTRRPAPPAPGALSLSGELKAMLADVAAEVSYPFPQTATSVDDYIAKLIANAEIILWRKKELEAFIAFYCNDPRGDLAYLTMLAVRGRARRQGIGKGLLAAMLSTLRARGFRRCGLRVRAGNTAAVRLYESFGFRRLAGSGDAIDMELILDRSPE